MLAVFEGKDIEFEDQIKKQKIGENKLEQKEQTIFD